MMDMKKIFLFILACCMLAWAVTSCEDPLSPDPVTPETDTTAVTPDTIVAPSDTIVVPSDSTLVPSDSIVNPQDTIVNPQDTIVNPQDTIVNPQDTVVTPPQDTVVTPPLDTVVTPPDTVVTPEPVLPPRPESFPKKHLIEEFTGQDCGYCPYGMDCVHDFIGNDTNWIVVLHHYGYQKDHFSVSGSQNITSKLGVNGAPTIAVNRATTKSEAGRVICFHPGYLPTTGKQQFSATTYVSLNISNTYDEASRTLQVHLSGMTCNDDHPALMLTVMLKESGMVDYQQDYYGTYEGWKEFRHTNAVRAFLSAPLGDSVHVDNTYQWSADYELQLDSKWVPENCAVVALVSEAFKPVVQAEQRPVVRGTRGGADIQHGGITAVPVADYYPEPGTDISPMTYSGREADTLTVANAYYTPVSSLGVNYWQIQAYNSAKTVKVNRTSCVPFADFYLFTSLDVKTIPVGTYELNNSMQPGTAYAGYRDDENVVIEGSSFYYISKTYFQQGYLVPQAQWLIVDGTLTVTESGWSIDGHAMNGTDIHLFGSKPVSVRGRASAPRKTRSSGTKSTPAAERMRLKLAGY